MQANLTIIDYSIVIVFFALLFVVKFIFKKQADAMKSNSQLDDYFLAGRKLTMPVFVATLVSTWYGNLLGIGETAFKHGLVNWLTQGFFWYIAYFVFVMFFVDKVYGSGARSFADLIEKYYGKSAAIIAAFINFIMLNPAVYILSVGVIFSLIFGIDKKVGLLIGAVIPLIYTFLGGFRAVVLTDMIQFLFMFVGVMAVVPFAMFKYGGFDFLQNLPASHLSLTGDWSWQVILSWLVIAFWTMVDPNFFQRTYAAKDLKTAKRGILYATLFWFIFDIGITLIGLYAYAAMPELDAVKAMPTFAMDVLPPVFKGIFFAGVLATIMSTLDSLCFAASMCLSYDIYGRLVKDPEPKKIIFLNKLALILTVIAGIVIAIFFDSLLKIMYFRGTIAISALFVPLCIALFAKQKPPKETAVASMLVGALSSIAVFVGQKFGFDLGIEPLFVGLGLSMISLILFRLCFSAR